MRADRLLSILLLLQTHGRMTARELAGRLEVSERTVYRDMDALSAAGVPVYAERGSGGGWALVDGYETHLTGLSVAEVNALFATRPLGLLADLGLGAASDAALLTLLAALPQVSRQSAEHARQRLHVDTTAWKRTDEDLSALGVLQEVIWKDRRIRFTYLRVECEPAERVGDPLGLVAKGSAWYLVATVDGEIRSYRVGRIRDVVVLDERAERPNGFDLAAHWEASSAQFREALPRYYATVRAAPNIKQWMWWTARYAHVEREGEPDADGWVEMDLRFQVVEEAVTFAMSFGPKVEVISPPELRDTVRALAAETAARYR